MPPTAAVIPVDPTVAALQRAWRAVAPLMTAPRSLRRVLRRPSRAALPGVAVPDGVATAVVVAALVGVNVAQHFLSPAWWLAPVTAALLVGFARLSGLSWAQLGLSPDRWRHGSLWGLGAIAAVAAVYVAGLALPSTRTAFLDSRYHLPLPAALMSAFVVIPIGTVLIEEIAFRSVLWGVLSRHTERWGAVLASTSALFGLWHILPSLHLGQANQAVGQTLGGGGQALVVAATVAFTALGGVVAGELRRRSGSVLASAGMHWATNALGVLAGLVAWRLVR